MRNLIKVLAAGTALTALASMPAGAQVSVGIGVGAPAPSYYYGTGYYPPGPCDSYNYYYAGDCGYPVYSGDVMFDGAVVSGPHYYRWDNDHPSFWYRGSWHSWDNWHNSNYHWEHRGWHS